MTQEDLNLAYQSIHARIAEEISAWVYRNSEEINEENKDSDETHFLNKVNPLLYSLKKQFILKLCNSYFIFNSLFWFYFEKKLVLIIIRCQQLLNE